MKTRSLLLLISLCLLILMGLNLAASAQQLAPAADDDWKLAIQAWSFNRYSFFEAVDKTVEVGLKYIEAYPGQKITSEAPQIIMGPALPPQERQKIKDKLQASGVKLIAFGVCDLPPDEAASRKIFEFAKDMGIEVLTSEPPAEAMPLVDKLCNEYGIRVAIHNHPFPSKYWNPDAVLKACEGRSNMIGSCSDTGHWFRSKLVPVDCLKKLEGRIVSLHLKDIKEGHDVVWGQGECNVPELLKELKRQNFKGVFSIEYEYNWENSVPEIAQCVAQFKEMEAKIAARQ